jgi:hypothetical protein
VVLPVGPALRADAAIPVGKEYQIIIDVDAIKRLAGVVVSLSFDTDLFTYHLERSPFCLGQRAGGAKNEVDFLLCPEGVDLAMVLFEIAEGTVSHGASGAGGKVDNKRMLACSQPIRKLD